jgi:plastocyanin
MRRIMRLSLLPGLGVALAAASLFATRPAAAQTPGAVSIINFAFQPSPIHVAVGSTVQWTNNDPVAHTSTSDNGLWDSTAISPGNSFKFTFTSAGTFAYHCAIHPGMLGSVIVDAAAAPTATVTPTSPAASTPTSSPTATATSPGGQSGTDTPVPASATPTPTDTPVPPTATETPIPPLPALSIKVQPRTLHKGTSITLTITVKAGSPSATVRGVTVKLDGRSVGMSKIVKAKTNGHGKVVYKSLHPSRAGTVVITVSKQGFKSAKLKLHVT